MDNLVQMFLGRMCNKATNKRQSIFDASRVRLTLNFWVFRAEHLDVSQTNVQQKHLAPRVKCRQLYGFKRHANDGQLVPAEAAA
jgi:hypothetical protein